MDPRQSMRSGFHHRARSVRPPHLSANLVSPARPNERIRKTFGVCRTRMLHLHQWAVLPALRSRSSEREKKLSNRLAVSSFFQNFRPVDLRSPPDLSDLSDRSGYLDILTDLWSKPRPRHVRMLGEQWN